MIYNPYLLADVDVAPTLRRSLRVVVDHQLVSLPKGKKFDRAGRIVDAGSDYGQCNCQCSHVRKAWRTYCKCSPGIIYCTECYAAHRIATAIQEEEENNASY